MTTPKAVPTAQHSNIELYKTANKTASFIAEAMLDFAATDGKTYNKIVLVIVKRSESNKALATVRYFLDIAPAKVLMHDLWLGALHDDWSYDEAASQISRLFSFASFSRTIAFTNAVAWIATVEGHHPEMTVNYGSCLVMYRTHSINGLSDNDFICAAKIDLLVADA